MTQSLPCRCILFVPGNRPERFDKALSSGADRICIDLEDAVAPGSKVEARGHALDALERLDLSRVGIRINPPETDDGRADLAALGQSVNRPDFLMLPKFEAQAHAETTADAIGAGCPDLIVLVESARGLLELDLELDVDAPVRAVMFGGYDYSVDTGAAFAWESLLYARSHLVTVARAHALEVIDVPFVDIRDQQGLAEETRKVRDLGFHAKTAIHPNQVDVIQQAFQPSKAMIENARRVIEAANSSGGEAVQLDGRLIDAPVIEQARRTLALARLYQ